MVSFTWFLGVQDQATSAEGVQPKVRPSSTPPQTRASGGRVLVKTINLSPKSHNPLAPGTNGPKTLSPDSNDIRVESVDAESCGTRLCSGRGECVLLDGQMTCDCVLGYRGESCEFEVGGFMQGPVIYATMGLAVGVIILGVIVGIIQKKKAANQR